MVVAVQDLHCLTEHLINVKSTKHSNGKNVSDMLTLNKIKCLTSSVWHLITVTSEQWSRQRLVLAPMASLVKKQV